MPPPCEAAGIPPFDSTSGLVPSWTGAGSACTCSPPGGPSVSPIVAAEALHHADRSVRFRHRTCKGRKKSGMKAKCYYYIRPRDQSSRVSTHVDSLTARLTEEEKVAAKLTQEGSSVPPLLFRRRGNAPAAGELLSCPAAARRSSPLQLPEREWAHRGLRQRGSSRQRPGAVQRAWRLRSRCHPHQPRHLQVQRALEGPLLRLCGVPFVWVRCRPRELPRL